MSSGESRTTTSSRLSQFGLYRSIDARTEEFLRLSRKRQIRQGCACAAVSTAITVTVVITVLLVYEYNVTTETNIDQKSNKNPNWLGFFNDSAPFDAKYNKAKLNLDPTTLKLLPIILKALNHNRYLEKLIEDSSSSPVYERKDTTEFTFKKNVFSGSKNWNKNPSSKTSEIEYKTSPIAYFKLPSNNLDYYSKIRKIRDYQRMLNYFDKMISEKVNSGSSQPVHIVTQTEKPLKQNVRAKTQIKTVAEKPIKTSTSIDCPKNASTKSEGCKCPKKLGLLLRKLIASIQELIPEIMIAKSPCDEKHNNNHPIHINSKVPNLRSTKSPRLNTKSKANIVTKKCSTTTERVKRIQGTYIIQSENRNPQQTLEQNSSDIDDDTRSLHQDYIKQFYKKYFASDTTTTKGSLEATKANYAKEATTVPMSKNKQNIVRNQIIAEKDEIVGDKTTESYNYQRSMTTPDYKDEYSDYVTMTNKNYNNNLNGIVTRGFQHNTDRPSERYGNKQKYTGEKIDLIKFITKKKETDLSNLSKIYNSTDPVLKTVVTYITKSKAITPPTSKTDPDYDSTTKTRKTYSRKDYATKTNYRTTQIPPWNISTSNIPKRNFEDEETRPTEDDIQEEESMKQIETLNNHIRPALKYEKDRNFNYSSLQSGPVTIKTTDSSKSRLRFEEIKPRQFKSMLPISRPIYLEINRNFKHDTSDDYNANPMDQNIFDLY